MGLARLLGPSGGFIFGYLFGTFLAGLILGVPKQGEKIKLWRLVLAVVSGLLVVYIPGLLRLKFVLNIDWSKTIAAGFYPFLLGDAIKGVIATLITPRLRRTAARQLTINW
jgi:biotin transport system substrate-specific component